VVKDLKAGERLTGDNVRAIRPGLGLAPRYLEDVLGRTVTRDVPRGTPLSWNLL
jgi:sialic acid synthase SpsE